MLKKFRYEYIGGPLHQWHEAAAYVQGYRNALITKGLDPGDIKYVVSNRGVADELRDGCIKRSVFKKSGFYCVKKIKLTKEEIINFNTEDEEDRIEYNKTMTHCVC